MFQLLLEVQTIHPRKGLRCSKAWVSKSFVKNILLVMFCNLKDADTQQALDTSGTLRNNTIYGDTVNIAKCVQVYGGSKAFSYQQSTEYFGHDVGIQVGNGSAANTALTYTLHQKIAHGVGSGQLEYSGGFPGAVTVSGSDSYFDIERIFRNSSGGSIVVKEYSLVGFYTDSGYPVLIVRDVFTDPGDWVTVANGEYLKVTYRLLVTV